MQQATTQFHEGFWLYKDELYGIYMARDHYNGVALQIVEFVKKTRLLDDGQIKDLGKQPQIVWQKIVYARAAKEQTFKAIAPTAFSTELNASVAEAKAQLSEIRQLETMIAGGMNNYVHQAKPYNIP